MSYRDPLLQKTLNQIKRNQSIFSFHLAAMKKLPILPTLTAALCGLTALLTTPLIRAQNGHYPEGDLTVTVEELEDGGVRISLSGSTTFLGGINSEIPQNNGWLLDRTNFSYSPPTPPSSTSDFNAPLPAGLTLAITVTAGQAEAGQVETSPPFLPSSAETIPLDSIRFEKGSWRLESSAGASPDYASQISGSGSVTIDDLPFYHFVSGTYGVGPQENPSEPENADPVPFIPGQEDYHITYEVIPFTPAPAIRLSHPGRFPATRIFRSARNRNVTLTNTGNMKLTRLALSLSGAARSDFSTSRIPVASLEAGKSTQVSVSFRPRRAGVRRALLTVMGTTELREAASVSEVEPSTEEVLPETVAPMTVFDTVELQGTGLPIKPRPWPGSPRFPRGFYGN